MYHAICGFDGDETCGIWTMIWRLKGPERVRAFVWLVKHGRLLTNERKHRMGLGSDRCDYCFDCTETILHVLRDCTLIRPLWISAVDTAVRHQFFTSNLEDLIVINISCKGGISSNEGWSNFWAMACHLAWSWRNKEKHEDFMRPMKQTEFVRQKLHCYTLADKANYNSCKLETT
jgi:hypothetical protein